MGAPHSHECSYELLWNAECGMRGDGVDRWMVNVLEWGVMFYRKTVKWMVTAWLLVGLCVGVLGADVARGQSVVGSGQQIKTSELVKGRCPLLGGPGAAGAEKLAMELWQRIDSIELKLDGKELDGGRGAVRELQDLHGWLSQEAGYGNLLLASMCEHKIHDGVGKGLMAGSYPPAEATAVLNALLANRVKRAGVAKFIEKELPEFASARKVAEALKRGETVDLIRASANLVEEQGQDFLNFPRSSGKLLEEQDGARVLQYYAMGLNVVYLTKGLAEYEAAGGDLADDQQTLLADLPVRIPKFFTEASAGTGGKWQPMGLVHARDHLMR